MENKDLELIEKSRATNYELDRLYTAHLKLDEVTTRLEQKAFLTPEEKKELVDVKKQKLDGRDLIERILQTLR